MIQGSTLPAYAARRLKLTDGILVSINKDCLIVPPVFTVGKSHIKKGDTVTLTTLDTIQTFENLVIVEWHPDLEKYSANQFYGTPVVGPAADPRGLKTGFVASRDFNISKLPWLCKLYIQER